MYTYYVYHIPGIKIGCTTDLNKRMKDQGFTNWEILWQEDGNYEFGWIAGNKEIELQKQYGYKIDNNNYQISRNNRRLSELNKLESKKIYNYRTSESSSRGGITTTKNINHQKNAAKASINSLKHNTKQTYICELCGRIIISLGGLNSHKRKHKKSETLS